jgi:hypothetical protein
LEVIPVRREAAVTCFLLAALLMLLLSRYLLRRVRARRGPAAPASVEETTRVQPRWLVASQSPLDFARQGRYADLCETSHKIKSTCTKCTKF